MTNNLGKGLVGRLLVGLAMSLLFGAYSIAQEKYVYSFTVTKEGKFQLLDVGGKALSKCQLCTKELLDAQKKQKCEELKLSPPLCVGSTNAALASVDVLAVITTHKNPYCFVYYQQGQMYQGPCYCYPGETAPPGITCVNR